MYLKKFRVINIIGGEPFLPYETKEGITFAEHTIKIVRHAANKGMIINVTTNGDFVTAEIIEKLRLAGLDSLTFSLHSFTDAGLKHIIKNARTAAQAGLVPVVNTVFTSENWDGIPRIAATLAQNGILLSTAVVQEKGEGFSTAPDKSLIPTMEQKKKIFSSLLRLKSYGFIRNNRGYLKNAQLYEENSWKCDPEKDAFIHIGSGGKVNVCSEKRTNLNIAEIDLGSTDWRERKRAVVRNCGGCLYNCYFESQNPDLLGEIPTYLVMLLIKSGNVALAERLGKFAVQRIRGLINF